MKSLKSLLMIALALTACGDRTDMTSLESSRTTLLTTPGLRLTAACVSVWDVTIDGDRIGLLMFTDTTQAWTRPAGAGRHRYTVTRWSPAPVTVFEDSVLVSGATALRLPCR